MSFNKIKSNVISVMHLQRCDADENIGATKKSERRISLSDDKLATSGGLIKRLEQLNKQYTLINGSTYWKTFHRKIFKSEKYSKMKNIPKKKLFQSKLSVGKVHQKPAKWLEK